MELILVRHGIAEATGGGVRRDRDRRLTEEGVLRTRQAAQGLREISCMPSVILSSPYARAKETADVLAAVLTPPGGVEIMDALAAGDGARQVVRGVAKRPEPVVMLVGHMPDMSEIAGLLLSGRTDLGMEFKKAAACCLVCESRPVSDAAWLRWLLPPGVLRRLGGPVQS